MIRQLLIDGEVRSIGYTTGSSSIFLLATMYSAIFLMLLVFSGPVYTAQTEKVVIYAATDFDVIQPLIADFEAAYPNIRVEYHDMHTTEVQARFLAEAEGKNRADILWSSAMDLQMRLVNDGYALPYRSAETAAMPAWAKWKDEAFGITFEPVCFVYNSRKIAQKNVPQSHAELVRLLSDDPEIFGQRLVTYDPHRSGLGYLLHTQDLEANPVVFWKLIRTMATQGLLTEATSTAMLNRISSGQSWLGYNVLCSYAHARRAESPDIEAVMPRDYTLVMSRIAFINRRAPQPENAKKWLDYVLSRRGQTILNAIGLHSVRSDIENEASAESLRRRLGAAFRPIVLNTGLLTYIDHKKRERFLELWDEALQGK